MSKQIFVKDGYGISDRDETGDPKYYGFLDEIGNWYIMSIATDSAHRYVRGSVATSYVDAWTNRASLSYDYYNLIF